jgi:PhnB protein
MMSKTSGVSRRQFMESSVCAAAMTALPVRSTTSSEVRKAGGEDVTKLMPYLLFDGKCREAMEFYQSCLGGDLRLTKVKDTPAKDQMPAIQHDKVLNAHLTVGPLEISASDWLALSETPARGNMDSLFLSGGTLAEMKAMFEKLSAGANVTNPLKPTYFGTYGDLIDRFGVRWMFAGNYAGSKEG